MAGLAVLLTPESDPRNEQLNATRTSEILNGKRGVSADTAIWLGRYFWNSPQFWMNLQAHYDIRQAASEN